MLLKVLEPVKVLVPEAVLLALEVNLKYEEEAADQIGSVSEALVI